MGLHRLEVRLGHEIEPGRRRTQPIGAQLHLPRGLLARHVEHGAGALGQLTAHLEQQRGLADSRIAADQHQPALHHAAAQDPIQLAHPGRDPLATRLHTDVGDGLRASGADARPRGRTAGRGDALLDQLHVGAHPRAVRARARLGRGQPALLAAVGGTLPRHQRAPDSAARPESMVERIRLRSRKLRRAPSRNCTRFS